MTVMQSLRSPRANCSSLAHIYGDIKCIAMDLELYLLAVLREVQILQHLLLVWLEEPPQPAQDALYVDSIGL